MIFRFHSKRNWISGTADPQPGGMLFLQYSKSLEEHPPFQISTEKWKGMRRHIPIHTGRIKSDRYSRCIRILYPKAAVSGVLLHEPTDKKVNSNSLFYRNPVLIITISSILKRSFDCKIGRSFFNVLGRFFHSIFFLISAI